MKILKTLLVAAVALLLLAVIGAYSGTFNVGADDPHWGLTQRFLEIARDRSIERRAAEVSVPANLADAKLIASGAAEYSEMCTGCHLAPGMKDTELRIGLNPQPPNLSARGDLAPPAEQFWIIKHGIKMTGMPAWGLTHDDQIIWSMVAFLQKLPDLTPDAYQDMIESGEGGHHHHDGMESGEDEESAPPDAKLPASVADPAAAVDDFQKRLATGNTAGAAALLDPAVLIFESGDAEKSRAEYAAHHLPADAKFLAGAQVQVLTRQGGAAGDLAWVATESRIRTSGPKPSNLFSTETMILERSHEGWRVAHIHWSSRPAHD